MLKTENSSSIYYSIIIPHYNVPQLLQRLLDSIPQRIDTEVIVVDDNSDATKVDLNNFPGNNRPDVRLVFCPKNGGGGYARNKGLEVARGERILFADADDFFLPTLNDVLDEYKETKEYDIVFFRISSLTHSTYRNNDACKHNNKELQDYEDGKRYGEYRLRNQWAPCYAKIFSAKLIHQHHLRFEETPVYNDIRFGYLTGYYAKNITTDSRSLYCFMQRENSVSSTLSKNTLFVIGVLGRKEKFIQQIGVARPRLSISTAFLVMWKLKHHYPKHYQKAFNLLLRLGYTRREVYTQIFLLRILLPLHKVYKVFRLIQEEWKEKNKNT